MCTHVCEVFFVRLLVRLFSRRRRRRRCLFNIFIAKTLSRDIEPSECEKHLKWILLSKSCRVLGQWKILQTRIKRPVLNLIYGNRTCVFNASTLNWATESVRVDRKATNPRQLSIWPCSCLVWFAFLSVLSLLLKISRPTDRSSKSRTGISDKDVVSIWKYFKLTF